MKILIYGLNYAPELTGTGKYTAEMAVLLASRGHEVRVVCAPPYYPEWQVADGLFALARIGAKTRDGVRSWRAPLWVPARPTGREAHGASGVVRGELRCLLLASLCGAPSRHADRAESDERAGRAGARATHWRECVAACPGLRGRRGFRPRPAQESACGARGALRSRAGCCDASTWSRPSPTR